MTQPPPGEGRRVVANPAPPRPRKLPLRQYVAAKRAQGLGAKEIAHLLNGFGIKTSGGMRWSAADVTKYEAARAATSAARTPAPRR